MRSGYRHEISIRILILTTFFALPCFSLLENRSPATDWDLLIFTQNWPKSVCDKWSAKGRGNTCYNYPQNTWTIHGIWPTKFGTIGPSFCDISKQFSPEAIYGIEKQLMQVWSPVENHKKRYTFWAHEWEKHGTCAVSVPELSTEFDYFNKGIELFKEYRMDGVLEKAGVRPGQSYNITQIWDGVKEVLDKKPQVACYTAKGGISVLLEVRICFDKKFNLVDCDGTVVGVNSDNVSERKPKSRYQYLTNCPIERAVRYPGGSPQKLITSSLETKEEEDISKDNQFMEFSSVIH